MNVIVIRSVAGYIFDATFRETHESILKITDNPVEAGVVVSDHAYMEPLKLTISAGVSDTPLHATSNDPFTAGGRRSKTAFDLMRKLQATAEPINIQTGLTLYQDMVCTGLRTDQDKDTSRALVFEAEFREVIRVTTQVVTYPPRQAGRPKRQASAKKVKGEQQGTEVGEPKKGSILSKMGLAGPLSKFFTTLTGGTP